MNAVDRRVKLLVGAAVARAYGYVASVEAEVCESCDGDGCQRCWWTGEPPRVGKAA